MALTLDPHCEPAKLNLARLLEYLPERSGALGFSAQPVSGRAARPERIALLSFLFNWPSTGGGIVHTVELASFLGKAGFDVRLFHARYAGWSIGEIRACIPSPARPSMSMNHPGP
jgi:hypothetical protein